MKKIAAVLLALVTAQIYAQKLKDNTFTSRVFYSDFNDSDKTTWPLKNNQYYFLLIQDGKYYIESKSAGKKAYLLPKHSPAVSEYKVEAAIKFDKSNPGDGSIGIALQMNASTDSGMVVELNRKGEYRVQALAGEGNYMVLTTGKKGGWISSDLLKKEGLENRITIITEKGKNTLYFNGAQAWSFSKTLGAGKPGLFIDGQVKAEVNDFAVYTTGSTVSTGNYDLTKGSDITTVSNALLECRKDNHRLQADNESLKTSVKELKDKQAELQNFIKENLDIKLQAELEKTKKERDRLKTENDSLQSENKDLRNFKKTIADAKDGDLVIVISENLKKEKEKNEALSAELKRLQDEKKKGKGK